jgi:hypothetical protein
MNNRWFNTAVVVFWLATMSWLVKEKVLPSFVIGEPPSYLEVIEAQNREPAVGWEIFLDGRRIGWALTETKRLPTRLTEIHGRAHFDVLPVQAVMPAWLQPFSRLLGKSPPELKMDGRSELSIDTFGRLLRFDSAVHVEPWDEMVSIHGAVDEGQLKCDVRTGEFSFAYVFPLPPKSLLSDALSPQSRLPGLHVGQTWTVPVFNPLWPSTSPIEIIHATVEESEPIVWGGVKTETRRVVYRRDPGSGPKGSQKPQGQLWVGRDGAVLRQEVILSKSTICFVRMPDNEAAQLAHDAGPRWWTFEGRPAGGRRP